MITFLVRSLVVLLPALSIVPTPFEKASNISFDFVLFLTDHGFPILFLQQISEPFSLSFSLFTNVIVTHVINRTNLRLKRKDKLYRFTETLQYTNKRCHGKNPLSGFKDLNLSPPLRVPLRTSLPSSFVKLSSN